MPSRCSTATISAITDKVIPDLKAVAAMEKVYPFVWLDAIHYKVREDGRYQEQGRLHGAGAESGRQKVLGLYLSESEALTSGYPY